MAHLASRVMCHVGTHKDLSLDHFVAPMIKRELQDGRVVVLRQPRFSESEPVGLLNLYYSVQRTYQQHDSALRMHYSPLTGSSSVNGNTGLTPIDTHGHQRLCASLTDTLGEEHTRADTLCNPR